MTGEIHFTGVGISIDYYRSWLCGLGKQLSEYFWWALGNRGEHSSGSIRMQYGASGGMSVLAAKSMFPSPLFSQISKSVYNPHTCCSAEYTEQKPLFTLLAEN